MKKRWFTLIEMLIVIVIIGILAWALIPRIWNARDKANDVAREANVKSIATAMSQALMDSVAITCDANAVPYAALWRYWITASLNGQPQAGNTYKCILLKDNHFIVWTDSTTDDETNVNNASNCQSSAVSELTNESTFATASALVDNTPAEWTFHDSYCMVQ